MSQPGRQARRERQRRQRREDILETALRLFSQRGFHEVSMQEVADAAGFAVGTLYNCFASKDALFDELHRWASEKVLQRLLAELHAAGSPVARLRAFIRCLPEVFAEHGDFIRLYVARVGDRINKLCNDTQNQTLRATLDTELAAAIQQGIEQGLLRPVHPMLAAKALGATVETLAFEGSSPTAMDLPPRELFGEVERLFVDGLLAAREGRS